MRVLTSNNGDLKPYFDKNNENETNNTSLKQLHNNNHTGAANKEKNKRSITIGIFSDFVRIFEKVVED